MVRNRRNIHGDTARQFHIEWSHAKGATLDAIAWLGTAVGRTDATSVGCSDHSIGKQPASLWRMFAVEQYRKLKQVASQQHADRSINPAAKVVGMCGSLQRVYAPVRLLTASSMCRRH